MPQECESFAIPILPQHTTWDNIDIRLAMEKGLWALCLQMRKQWYGKTDSQARSVKIIIINTKPNKSIFHKIYSV